MVRMKLQVIGKQFTLRFSLYMAGVVLMSLGLALFLQAGLGFPVNSSMSYVLGLIFDFKYSYSLTIINIIMVVMQIFILGKGFKPIQLLQIPLSLVLGVLVELFCQAVEGIALQNYFQRFIMLLAAIVLLSLAISLIVNMRLVPMPLEGLTLSITEKIGKYPLHKVKRAVDVTIVAITVSASFAFFGRLEGAREGTILTALSAASIMEFFTRRLNPVYRLAGCGYEREERKTEVLK